MEKNLLVSFVCLLILILAALSAQGNPGTIRLAKAAIDTSLPQFQNFAAAEPACSLTVEGTRLYVVQPKENFSPEEKAAIQGANLFFFGHVPPNAYIIEASESQVADLKKKFSLLYCGEYLPEYKLLYEPENKGEASLCEYREPLRDLLLVVPVKSQYGQAIWQAMEKLGIKGMKQYESDPSSIKASLSPEEAKAVAAIGEVAYIEPYIEVRICNDVARSYGICNVDGLQMKGYYGKGQIICVQDTGLDNGDTNCLHPDFLNKKVRGRGTWGVFSERGTYDDWSDAGNHGTHVAGSTCGTGAASQGQFAGMAREADLFVLCGGASSGGIYTGTDEDIQNTYNQGARIMNNSWGGKTSGDYGSKARQYDSLIWNNKDYAVCFSSGNYASSGIPTTCNLGSASMAKNIITVGASETYRPNLQSDCWPDDGVHQGMGGFSSTGPCADGRTKPDIVAPGTGIYSALASKEKTSTRDQYYTYMGGTSMASPITAGCCAVIRDYLISNRKVAAPSASLVKAVLLSGGRTLYPGQYAHYPEIPKERPNNVEGHGHVNVQESLEPRDGKMDFVEFALKKEGDAVTNYFEATAGHDLTVILAWTDYPGTVTAEKALVNDLDLAMTAPDGQVYFLNNHLDNVESFRVPNAPEGRYTLVTKATTLMEGPQAASLVFNYGNGLRPGKIAIAGEPKIQPGKDYCDIVVTNLIPGSYISMEGELLDNARQIFSLENARQDFTSYAIVRLRADYAATEEEYPTCTMRLKAGSAGAVEKIVGAPNGSKEAGYVLYRADYGEYPYKEDYDAALRASGQIANAKPRHYDTVKAVDFEDYVLYSSVIGSNGWSLGYGSAANGSATVQYEMLEGQTNKYLRIDCLEGKNYAPHLKIDGLAKGWEGERAQRYYKISFKARIQGQADRTISLWNPSIAETRFKRYGKGFALETSYGGGSYRKFMAQGYFFPDVWTECEMLIDAAPTNIAGGVRHMLRHVSIGGLEEDCEGVYSESGNSDVFAALRFFQFGLGTFDLDDLEVSRCVGDACVVKSLRIDAPEGAMTPGELTCGLDIPEGFDKDYDLVVKAGFSLDGEADGLVFSQDKDHRQFQSEVRKQGSQYGFYLTDYKADPELIKTVFASNMVMRFGYRINAGAASKVLRKLFVAGENVGVDGELTAAELCQSSAIGALRFCLPSTKGSLQLLSLEARLLPLEKARLCLAPENFYAGSPIAAWTLTNSAPKEAISFTAAITGNGKSFAVSPSNGTFTAGTTLEIRALNPSDDRGYEWGELTIDAGEAGREKRIFGHQLGNDWNGYVLYDDAISPEGQVTFTNSLWTVERAMQVAKMHEDGEDFLRISRLRASTLTFDDQGAFLHIGAPMGHSTNLNFHVTGEIRFPDNFKGYFYLTQDEDHRQFQTAFSAVSSGSDKQAKVTLTDYTRNTNLINERLATGVWQPFDLLINALPSKKVLEEITVGKTTKVEGQKIGGQKVKKPDEIAQLRFNLTYADQAVDVKNLKVTLDNPVPEPIYAGLLLVLFALASKRGLAK